MTLGSIILTEQFSPGEVGHEEVAHVDDANDDAHSSHGQARINVPENKHFKLCGMTQYDAVWRKFEDSVDTVWRKFEKTEWIQLENSLKTAF